jgi:hypothetical protein
VVIGGGETTVCFSAQARVEQADTVADVLAAADEAFGQMLAAVDSYHESGEPSFAAMVLAAAVAADGRHAIASAPSMPPRGAGPALSWSAGSCREGEALAAALARALVAPFVAVAPFTSRH